MNRRTIIIISVVALLVLAVIGKSLGWWGSKGDLMEVDTVKVSLQTITETVNASGRIQPEEEIKISPEVSGEIVELAVIEGQAVSKGQVLLRINPDTYQAMVSRAEASVNVAKAGSAQASAQFIEAKASYERSQTLHQKGVISTSEWEAAERMYRVAELSVESAKYQLASAKSTLKEARDNLKCTVIVAPIDGTVTGLVVERGERVVGTAQMAGTQLMNVARLESMEVQVDVNENDIVRVEMGDTADVKVDAFLGHKFKAVVTEISNAATGSNMMSQNQVTNFQVKMRVLPESYQELVTASRAQPLRSGMTATVDIHTDQAHETVALPIEAVATRTDTADASEMIEVVFVVEDDKVSQVNVETGIQDDQYIQVRHGVDVDMEVVSGPFDALARRLKDGSKVEVKEDSKEDED